MENPSCCVMGELVKRWEVCRGGEKATHGDHGRSPAYQSSDSQLPGERVGHARLLERVAQLQTLHCYGQPQSTLGYQSLKEEEGGDLGSRRTLL